MSTNGALYCCDKISPVLTKQLWLSVVPFYKYAETKFSEYV